MPDGPRIEQGSTRQVGRLLGATLVYAERPQPDLGGGPYRGRALRSLDQACLRLPEFTAGVPMAAGEGQAAGPKGGVVGSGHGFVGVPPGGVVVAPGSYFGPAGEGYVRFALVPSIEDCRRAAAILEEAL